MREEHVMRKFWTVFTVFAVLAIGLTSLALTFIDEPVFAGVCGHHTWRDPATRPSIPGDASTCPTTPSTTTVTLAPPVVITRPPVTTTVTWTPTPAGQCQEDDPCWDCHTMGNHICGPATVVDFEPPVTPGAPATATFVLPETE
jgi:hypothetical protein